MSGFEGLCWAIGAVGNVLLFITTSRWKATVIQVAMLLPLGAYLWWPTPLPALGSYFILLFSAYFGAAAKNFVNYARKPRAAGARYPA